MSTSMLYHIFNAHGVQYKNTKYLADKKILEGEISSKYIRCPECKSNDVIKFGYKERLFTALPVGNQRIELLVKIPRVCC